VDARRREAVPVSTKITVAHAHEPVDFHLYQELGDEENLHLEITSETNIFKFVVPLGVAIGAARKISALEIRCLRTSRHTDAEIAETVAADVDHRIENAHDPITQLTGVMTYGSVHDPREDQVSSGIEEMTRNRDQCVEILQLAEDVEMGRV
jgi:hypothetical protein